MEMLIFLLGFVAVIIVLVGFVKLVQKKHPYSMRVLLVFIYTLEIRQ